MITKERLELYLSKFNTDGSVLAVVREDDVRMFTVIVDSYRVVKVEENAFWLLWKSIWYTEGQQHVHLTKIVGYEVRDVYGTDWLEVTMYDDLGRTYRIDFIEPSVDVEQHAQLQAWREFKKDNAKWIDKLDKRIEEDLRP